jgi:SCY1-like protein 1
LIRSRYEIGRPYGEDKLLIAGQTETYIYIATERLVPLRWHIKRKSMSAETLKWGLCGVAVCMLLIYGIQVTDSNLQQTIKFINDDASSVHGALRAGSIYTSESGEWRVGGFEVLSSMKDDEAIIYVCYQWQTGPTDN